MVLSSFCGDRNRHENVRVPEPFDLGNPPVFPVLHALDASITEAKGSGENGRAAKAVDQIGISVIFAHGKD